MSSQKGNTHRTRAQKHKNSSAFVNDLHDTSHRTKSINNLNVSGVCAACKSCIEWKIKYKKYKPLTVPKKCTKCENKSINLAYHTVCKNCAKTNKVCAKCGKSDVEIVSTKPTQDEVETLTRECEQNLKMLSERQRRTIKRNCGDDLERLQSLKSATNAEEGSEVSDDDLEDFFS
ncbi:hypothetical protein CHUAL_011074 [Chamberlinius hualienensis]